MENGCMQYSITGNRQDPDSKSRERKDSQVDQMFCESLRGFKTSLLSAHTQSDAPNVTMKYKDLINSFEKVS